MRTANKLILKYHPLMGMNAGVALESPLTKTRIVEEKNAMDSVALVRMETADNSPNPMTCRMLLYQQFLDEKS